MWNCIIFLKLPRWLRNVITNLHLSKASHPNTISLSRHEKVCLSGLRFGRYLSHHQATWMIMSHIFKGNMWTFTSSDLYFFFSISFIVSVKVRIFPLNIPDIIIHVARWWEKYLSKRSSLKHTCSWHDKLLVLKSKFEYGL